MKISDEFDEILSDIIDRPESVAKELQASRAWIREAREALTI